MTCFKDTKVNGSFLVLVLVIGGFVAGAQTGPGGVGNATSNSLWLSADNGVVNGSGNPAANGEDVQIWTDRSGNARNAIQATAANRPNYRTGVLNTLPVITFTAANGDQLIAASVTTANVASVWAVASYSSLPSSNPGILVAAPSGGAVNAAPGDKCIGMWVSSGGMIWGRGIQSDLTSRDISQVLALSTNTAYIINNIYRSSGINQFVNNAASGSNAGHNGTLRSWRDVSVGRQGTESWNGNIAEIIFFNFEVNSAQRIIIDNYLAAKYGLTLAANDVYNKDNAANGDFDHEVAGIGRVDASNIHNDAQGSGLVRILNPSGLGNNEFLMWGHNNLIAQANNTSDVPGSMQARFERVWRVSEVDAAGTAVDVGSVDIRFDLSGLGAITATDLRLLVDTDNDGVFADETPISGASLVAGSVYQFTGVTAIANNRRFTIGTINSNQTPLPVELISFEASVREDHTIGLHWKTASEWSFQGFEVQRSPDGEGWESLDFVIPKGHSAQGRKYTWIDQYPYARAYYRLRLIDQDGSFRYCQVRFVDRGLPQDITIYPNPCDAFIYIQSDDGILQLEFFDLTGRTLQVPIFSESIGRVRADLTTLKPGVYILKHGQTMRKIVKDGQ